MARLDGSPGGAKRVWLLGLASGAPSAIDSSIDKMAGTTSYSTWIAAAAAWASALEVAATAAMTCPL